MTLEYKSVKCRFCGSSDTHKNGIRENQNTKKQRHFCKSCKKTFIEDDGFMRRKFSSATITGAVDLHLKKLSLRETRDHYLQHEKIKFHYTSIIHWERDFRKQTKPFVDSLKPNIQGTWMADELYHIFRKQHNFLWDVIHKETRFIIAALYSENRAKEACAATFLQAKRFRVVPKLLETDGLPQYDWMLNLLYKNKVAHVLHGLDRKTGINTKPCMNTMERVQGTFRDRLKVTRGFHSIKSAQLFLDSYCIRFNFLRSHMGLNGLTPAEVAGIQLGLEGNRLKQLWQMGAKFNAQQMGSV